MLIRNAAGIGTYTTGEGSSLEPGLWGRFKNSLAIAIDQAIGTTFEHHVVAGYRFLMRYYGKDDQVQLSSTAITSKVLTVADIPIWILSRRFHCPFPITHDF